MKQPARRHPARRHPARRHAAIVGGYRPTASRLLLVSALLLPGLIALAGAQRAHGQDVSGQSQPSIGLPLPLAQQAQQQAQSSTEDATPDTTMPPAAAPMTPQMYVDLAALGDMFEIESSKLALINSDNKDVKDFARHMVQDHTESADKLKGVVKDKEVDVTLPAELDEGHRKMLEQLQAARGEDFDKLYLKMQEEGHQQALKLQQAYADNGDAAELKTYATVMVPMIEKHLAALDKLVRAVNGNT